MGVEIQVRRGGGGWRARNVGKYMKKVVVAVLVVMLWLLLLLFLLIDMLLVFFLLLSIPLFAYRNLKNPDNPFHVRKHNPNTPSNTKTGWRSRSN